MKTSNVDQLDLLLLSERAGLQIVLIVGFFSGHLRLENTSNGDVQCIGIRIRRLIFSRIKLRNGSSLKLLSVTGYVRRRLVLFEYPRSSPNRSMPRLSTNILELIRGIPAGSPRRLAP